MRTISLRSAQEAIATLTTDQRRALVAECPDHILEYVEESGEIVSVDNAHKIATFTEDLAMLQNSMKDQPEDEDFVSVVQVSERSERALMKTSIHTRDELTPATWSSDGYIQ